MIDYGGRLLDRDFSGEVKTLPYKERYRQLYVKRKDILKQVNYYMRHLNRSGIYHLLIDLFPYASLVKGIPYPRLVVVLLTNPKDFMFIDNAGEDGKFSIQYEADERAGEIFGIPQEDIEKILYYLLWHGVTWKISIRVNSEDSWSD